MEYIKEITADLSGEMLFEYITAVQGDTARKIKVTLLSNNQPYEIPDNASAVFCAKKPDGTLVLNECTIKDGAIIAELTQQTLAVCGNARCQISILSANNDVLTTFPFIVKIIANNASDGEIESSNEFNALKDALQLAKSAREIVSEALDDISKVKEDIIKSVTTDATSAVLSAINGKNLPIYYCYESEDTAQHNGWTVRWVYGNGIYLGGIAPDCGHHPPYTEYSPGKVNKTSWVVLAVQGIKTEEGAEGYNHMYQIAFDCVAHKLYACRGWVSTREWGDWTEIGGASGQTDASDVNGYNPALYIGGNVKWDGVSGRGNTYLSISGQIITAKKIYNLESELSIRPDPDNFVWVVYRPSTNKLVGIRDIDTHETDDVLMYTTGGYTIQWKCPALENSN